MRPSQVSLKLYSWAARLGAGHNRTAWVECWGEGRAVSRRLLVSFLRWASAGNVFVKKENDGPGMLNNLGLWEGSGEVMKEAGRRKAVGQAQRQAVRTWASRDRLPQTCPQPTRASSLLLVRKPVSSPNNTKY